MVRIIFLLLYLFYNFAHACLHESTLKRTDGVQHKVCFGPELEGAISKSCLKSCQARKFSQAVVELKPTELEGGKNPHAVACTKQKGELYILRDEKGNEMSFCFAQDGSFVATDLIKFKLL